MARWGLKRTAGALAHLAASRTDQHERRVVLCYHSVNPSPSYLSLTPDEFDAHLDWLERHATVVALSDLVAGHTDGDGPHVAITFDDGYEDNHAHALPLLAKRGFTATFFLTAGFLERDEHVMTQLAQTWHTPVEQLAPLDWSQVEEMRAEGMSFGSHTWSHRNLASIGETEAQQELVRSKEVLESHLSTPISSVAFPWGKLRRHVTEDTFAAAGRAGYELAVFSLPRALRDSDPPLRIPRFGVGAEPVESLAGKVAGDIDWHAAVHERMPASVARALWPGDGEGENGSAPGWEAVDSPRVSAIVTTHNYARFLPDALDSVLGQSYGNLEIVVVDDGSTDDTADVVRRYADQAVRYVVRPQGGAGPARNTGLAATSAPLVAFLDADDAWLPDRVEAGIAHLRRHPQLALAAAHAFACDEQLQPTAVVPAATRDAGRMLDQLLVDNVVLNPSSVLVRREALVAAGGFSEISFGEDWDTWIEIAKRFPIGFIDRPLALVRRHDGSVSPRRYRTRLDAHRATVERHLEGYRPAWKRPIIRRRAASVAYFHAGVGSVKSGDRRVARRYALTSIALDPVTLARRKAKLLARVFLPEPAVGVLRKAAGHHDRFAEYGIRSGRRGSRA